MSSLFDNVQHYRGIPTPPEAPAAPEPPPAKAKKSIAETFEDWLALNPEAFPMFVRIALEYKRATGKDRWSADAIIHRMRWEYEVVLKRVDEFKISDHMSSRLSRKAMAENPELVGFFETRTLRS